MRCAVSAMRRQDATSQAIIFSHRTCRPASMQPAARSAWVESGVAITTPSSLSFWIISFQSA